MYLESCVFQALNLVNNYIRRKYARTFISKLETSNKLYTAEVSIRFLFFYGTTSNFVIPFLSNILVIISVPISGALRLSAFKSSL
jgi:hypothetical protein